MNLQFPQPKTIQQKIALWTGGALLATITAFVLYSTYNARSEAIENAKTAATYIAKDEASKVKNEIEQAMIAARTTGEALKQIKNKNNPISLSRDEVNAMLRSVNESHPQFVGTYTNWEPNTFDGRDSEFANKPGHDKTGRFLPYWEKNAAGAVQVTPLVDYDKEGPGDYYQIPKRTKQESIVGPYEYPVAGKIVTMASLVEPIVVDGQFYGISGVDLLLDFLQAQSDKVNIYDKTGQLILLNNEGVISAMTGRPELANKKLSEKLPDLSGILPMVKAGRESVELVGDKLRVVVPLQIGVTTTPWAACILIPRDKITASATSLALKQAFIGLAFSLLALAALWFLASRIAQPIQAAARFANQVATGQAVDKIAISSEDETGQLIRSMNSMLDSNNTLLQTRDDKDRIQMSVMKLLNDVSSVADGDLTRQADVSSDVTGAIADSFNVMTGQLRQIIGKVQAVSSAVNQSVSETQGQTALLAHETEQQAVQIIETSQGVSQMAQSIKEVSVIAETSKRVAEQSLITARDGAAKVESTIQSMGNLRDQVQETSKRIKRLGENSQEIGEIVQLIGDVAYRTSVLALNASIQAARAGEAGRGFGVVAEEVERLSKRSTEAAKRIAELVKTSQASTNDAIASMEENTRSVVESTVFVQEAGQALENMEGVNRKLAEMIGSITVMAERQVQESEAVAQTMLNISQATQGTAEGIKQSVNTVNQLAELADDLQGSVASFRVNKQVASPVQSATRTLTGKARAALKA